jgi:hypothetical protein
MVSFNRERILGSGHGPLCSTEGRDCFVFQSAKHKEALRDAFFVTHALLCAWCVLGTESAIGRRRRLSPEVLLKGMSREKHFSLPERQKYFPASSPPATLPTFFL